MVDLMSEHVLLFCAKLVNIFKAIVALADTGNERALAERILMCLKTQFCAPFINIGQNLLFA